MERTDLRAVLRRRGFDLLPIPGLFGRGKRPFRPKVGATMLPLTELSVDAALASHAEA